MIKSYLYLLAFFTFSGSLFAQTTETFETEIDNSTSFIDNGQSFNITSQLGGTFSIANYAGTGWNGTAADNKYIDNSSFAFYDIPVQFTISNANSTAFQLKSFYVFLSRANLSPGAGSLTITGKLNGATVFSASSSTGFNNNPLVNNGYTLIDLSTYGGANNSNTLIDSYTITTTGTFEYAALDTMVWVLLPNTPPTNIILSASTIDENVPANSTIGTLSSTDADSGNTFTYSLVAGAGSTDNASFNTSGSSLRISNSPDFETKSSYSVRVRTTDQGGLTFEKQFIIDVNNVNEAPTDIALSANTINENVSANSTVGTLSTIDADASNTFTYTLVSGSGSTDKASFSITGNSLTINASPDFETKSSYSVRIRTTDQGGLTFEKQFTITIINVNEAPIDIVLSVTSINENVSANSAVGTLSSTDADASNTFTYTLVAGIGSTDNASFNTSGSSLRISNSPDFETKSSYSVRIRTTDQGGLTFEKQFTITITNVNEAPTDIALSATSINENVSANSTVGTLSSTDADASNTFTYTLVSGSGSTDNASFNTSGSSLRISNSPDFETKSSYNVRVRTTDQGGLTFEKQFTITVNNVNEAPTDIALSATSINENVSANSAVGTLSSTDADASNTFTHILVAGTGSTDNASFSITGNSLAINASPDFETKSSYSVRIRTTDQGGLTFEKQFTITINDLCDSNVNISAQTNVSCNGGNNGAISLFSSGLLTSFTSNNSGGGISFDVVLNNSLIINGFDLNLIANSNVAFYYRSGTASGNELSSTGWILAGIASLTSNGVGNPTTFTLSTPLNLSAGNYGFYIVSYSNLRYSNGTSIANILASNSDMIIYEGKGRAGISTGSEFSVPTTNPRMFSGKINYGTSYLWSNGAITQNISSLAAGTYTVTATNTSTGCSLNAMYTITQPTAISTATGSQTNVSCNGGSNGSATVSPSGGTPGYTYSWFPSGGTAATAAGLSAGTYTVTVTDANGCTATRNFTITQPTTISTATAAQTNVSCNGGANGSATVSPSGGTPGYTYSWSPSGGSNDTASGLVAGSYTCTISDAIGCSVQKTVTITQPDVLTATTNQTDIDCNGGANGSATVSPTGGTPGYTYSWFPSGGTGATATGLVAGPYTCTITDANSCTLQKTVTLTEPVLNTITCPANIVVTNSLGQLGANVTFAATATGTPTPILTYSPASGSFFPIGTTTVTATATNSCGAPTCTFTVTVLDATPPIITCPVDITVCENTPVTYTVAATLPVAPILVSQTTSRGLGSGVSCTAGVNTYYRVFDLATLGYAQGLLLDTINFGVQRSGVNTTATITAYTLSGSFVLSNLTPIATQTVAISTLDNTFYSASMGGVIVPANSKLVLAYSVPYNNFYPSANDFGESGPSYISADNCGLPNPVTLASVGFGNYHLVLDFNARPLVAVTSTLVSGYASGSVFPLGTTTVTHSATNAAGISSDCSFMVTVTALPTITCPANITATSQVGQCGANVTFAATATGTPTPILTYSPASGSFFPIGTTTVTATATNSCGAPTCTFTVTVNDTEAPVITCPVAITSNSNLATGAIIAVGTATATDNCTIASINGVRSDALALTDLFPLGITTITWTATDSNGNLSLPCVQTITVNLLALYKSGAVGSNRSSHVNQNGAIGVSSINSNGRKITFIPTVPIAGQVWTQTNLNVTTYRDGTPIPEVKDPTAWANLTTGAWCHLNNDPANDALYGKMYNHYAVEDPRGLAPLGYHIPTLAEWFVLHTNTGSDQGKLRSTLFYSGTNDYSFSVLNGGSRYGNEVVNPSIPASSHAAGAFQTDFTGFWSSDLLPAYNGVYFDNATSLGSNPLPNNEGKYIRLIKN